MDTTFVDPNVDNVGSNVEPNVGMNEKGGRPNVGDNAGNNVLNLGNNVVGNVGTMVLGIGKKGSSGRARTYNPPVNRGLPCYCWELRIVAESFIVFHLPMLVGC